MQILIIFLGLILLANNTLADTLDVRLHLVSSVEAEPVSHAFLSLRLQGEESYLLPVLSGSDAMSDSNGFATLKLEAGIHYELSIKHLAYAALDTVLSFESAPEIIQLVLKPAAPIQFDMFTVEGAAVMVEVKSCEFIQQIGSENLTDYAVESVERSVARQNGVISKNGQLYARGGRRGEISFRVDGVAVDDPLSGGALGRSTNVIQADELWIIAKAEKAIDPRLVQEQVETGLYVLDDNQRVKEALPLRHTSVVARLDGQISSVRMTQRYLNPLKEAINAEYVFPLPHDAAVHGFELEIGDRRIVGVVREKEEAEDLYRQARRRGQTASLLMQSRPNIFRQKIANLQPGEAVDISLRMTHQLEFQDGEYIFNFPMVVGPRYQGADVNAHQAGLARSEHASASIDLSIDAGVPIHDLRSGSHSIEVDNLSMGKATVRLKRGKTLPNADFRLRFGVVGQLPGAALQVHARNKDEGFFSLAIYPPKELSTMHKVPVELIFILDCSGSMGGEPMALVKQAMRRALESLDPEDSFQVIRYSNVPTDLSALPLEATTENILLGLDYVEDLRAGGGTEMSLGIEQALSYPADSTRQRIISLMTDGLIRNEQRIFNLIEEKIGSSRIFSFGVGSSPNGHLLSGAAQLGNGAAAWVSGAEDLKAVDNFFARMRHPVLKNIELDWAGWKVSDLSLNETSDLLVGRPIMIRGKYEGSIPEAIRVSGMAASGRASFDIQVDQSSRDRPALELLWARDKIGHLVSMSGACADTNETELLEAQILELALEYQLMSSVSSFLAIDDSELKREEVRILLPVAVAMPRGMTMGSNQHR